MTFQLFGDLTPQTVARITTLTNDNYYTNGYPPRFKPGWFPGQYFPRITSVADSGFSVLQGGSSSATSTSSSSGMPPIATEIVQQLAFTGQDQLAMANTGSPDSTDAQFFITNGTLSQSVQQSFDFNYTIFGQLVSGQQTVTDLSKVAVQNNSSGEDSQPLIAGGHQLGRVLLDQSQWRLAHRHNRGHCGSNSHDHGDGDRPHRSHDGHTELHGHGRSLQWADQFRQLLGDDQQPADHPAHEHATRYDRQ